MQDSIEVFISEPVSAIIDRWGNKDKSGNNYVFNIYTLSMDTEEMFRQKQLKTRSINGYMKRLGKRLGIKVSISTSVARHSYATISKNNGIPVDEISESLGHSDVKTTRHYLGSFSKEHKIKTAKKIVDLFK